MELIDLPTAFLLSARFICRKLIYDGFSILGATVTFDFFITDPSSSWDDCEVSVFAAMNFMFSSSLDLPLDREGCGVWIFVAMEFFDLAFDLSSD